jgi:protein TonB
MELVIRSGFNVKKHRRLLFPIGLVIALGFILALVDKKSEKKSEKKITQVVSLPDNYYGVKPIVHEVANEVLVIRPQVADVLQIVKDKPKIDEKIIIEKPLPDEKIQPLQYLNPKESKGLPEANLKNEHVYLTVEEMPKFHGDDANTFREWIKSHTRYPQIAAENGISGRVIVQFAVNSRGEVVDISVVRPVDPSLDKEAVRVISSSPRWSPGKMRGTPVKVQFNFPVSFVLQQ